MCRGTNLSQFWAASCAIPVPCEAQGSYRKVEESSHLLFRRLDGPILRELIALILESLYSEPEVVDLRQLASHVCHRGGDCRLEEELVLLGALQKDSVQHMRSTTTGKEGSDAVKAF